MSNDPNEYYSNSGGEAYPVPGQPAPPYPPVVDMGRSAVMDRVRLPAVFLIVTAVINLMGCLLVLVPTLQITLMSDADWKKQAEMGAQVTEKVMGVKAPPGSEPTKASSLMMYWGWEAAGLVCTLLPLLGGIRMLALRNYALCIVGSLAGALPCLSVSACCGLGEVAGVWALIILMNDEVRSLFR